MFYSCKQSSTDIVKKSSNYQLTKGRGKVVKRSDSGKKKRKTGKQKKR